MEFLKNHYEKVLLSVMLLGLAVAVAFLPSQMPKPRETTGPETKQNFGKIDLKTNELAIKRLSSFKPLELSGAHNLLNPVLWRHTKEDTLIKVSGENVGPGAVKIDRIQPLLFSLGFDGMTGPAAQMTLVQQTNKNLNARGKTTLYVVPKAKQDLFKITRLIGPAENPTGVEVELKNSPDPITIEKGHPYEVVSGYVADLRYEPESLILKYQRVGDALKFDGDTNNIVEINSNSVVLSASSGTRTLIKLNTAP
jgi:hypothetical protein